jgi:tyrosyl-tRNA synthetase
MTARIHGADTARGVVEASKLLFGGTDLRAAGAAVLEVLAQEIPCVRLARSELEGLTVADALVRAGLASSKGDARRGVQGKGFSVNGEQASAADHKLGAGDLLAGRYVMLQKGKRSYALLAIE